MSVGRKIALDDALLLLRGWLDSRVLVNCHGVLERFSFALAGRIFRLDGDHLRVVSADQVSELDFHLRQPLECWYTDPREFPEEAKVYTCSLLFFFLPRLEPERATEFIAISEMAAKE